MKKIVLLTLISVCLFSCASMAKGERGERRGPPPEAIEACVDKAEGDKVSFETPRGDTVEGTCQVMDDTLVAMPEHHKER